MVANPPLRVSFATIFILILILIPAALYAQTPPPPDAIIFWHHYADDARADFWAALAVEYNAAHPDNIPVRVAFFPSYHHQHDAILAGLLNGDLPDVAFVREHHAALYQLSDSLLDLEGLPLTRSATALYINRDALAAHGFDDAPRNRDEFAAMACAYHAGRGWGDVQLVAPAGFDFPRDASFLMALGPHDAIDFESENWRDTFDFLLDLHARGCMSVSVDNRAEMQRRFATGQTVFYIDSSSARPFVEAAIADFFAEPFALEVMPIPSADAGPVSNWSGPGLRIFRSSPERETAARDWINWLGQPEQVARWAAVNHAYPARPDVDYAPEYEAFAEAMWSNEPSFAGYDLIRDELIFAALAIFAGEAPDTRLQSLSNTAREIKDAFD